jgi:hypothetical protein
MTTSGASGSLPEVVTGVEAAIRDLGAIRCIDPASREALRVVKLTAHTLRSFWLPTLELLADQRT